jgi:hypothetical protein
MAHDGSVLDAVATQLETSSPVGFVPAPQGLLASFRADLGELGAEVDRLKRDAGFRRILDTMARFWNYSAANQWLIRRARPGATRVAGRRLWEKLGRRVRNGEEPIQILAPMRPVGFPFRVVDVFDISQTTGRALPKLDLILRGRTRKTALLERAAASLGIRVVDLLHGSGLGESVGGEIRIRVGLPQRERAAVLAHELAHELLHQRDSERQRSRVEEETEAEATSYVVLRALGLPSKAPTYIAWLGGSGTHIARSLGRIQRASRAILEAART